MTGRRFRWIVGVSGLIMLAAFAPAAVGATRTFNFDDYTYGNPDELCANHPIPPLFSVPEFGTATHQYIVGDALPRGETTACGHGTYGGDDGSDSLVTQGDAYSPGNSNELRFSWETVAISVTGANWTDATKRLTKTDAFTYPAGTKVNILAGTGVTPGLYDIVKKIDNSNLELAASITGGADVTDNTVQGTIDPLPTAWLRVPTGPFSYTLPLYPSPTVDIGVGSSISMRIAIWTRDSTDVILSPTDQLEFGLVIRETGQNLPLGEDGGINGTVEFVGFDTKGMGADPNRPIGGTAITNSRPPAIPLEPVTFTKVEWTFVDDGGVVKADVSVDGGTPVRKPIIAYGGDGVLSATNNRATLDSLAICRPATDTSTKISVFIDDIVITAPTVTDPVKIKVPVTAAATDLTVQFIDPNASTVNLYKDAGSGYTLIATATAPPADFSSGTYHFTGLSPLAEGNKLKANQVVGGITGSDSAEVTVAPFGMIENFDTWPGHDASYDPANPSLPKYRHWYDPSTIVWAYADPDVLEGSNAMKIGDGGWTNGVYAIFESVFTSSGTFHAKCKMHVQELGSIPTYGYGGIMAYQMGVRVGGEHRNLFGTLAPCIGAGTSYGGYAGLTTANDTAKGPQIVTTGDFEAVAGQDLLVAFCTDVRSGGWNGSSYNWGTPLYEQLKIVVDDIMVLNGPAPVTVCGDVPAVDVIGPLLFGNTTVQVANVSAAAQYVYVYVNGVKKGTLYKGATGGGTKVVTLTSPLLLGDEVYATQDYPMTTGGYVESCKPTAKGIVGSGPNPGPITLTVGLRETNASGAIGADGGQTGAIEWLGATTVLPGTVPVGKLLNPSNDWQTVTFYPTAYGGNPADPVTSYEGGNGILNSSPLYRKGVLEHVGVAPAPGNENTGPYILYFDNISSGGATPTVFGDFETFAAGTPWVMFRNPRYLVTFAQYLLFEPSVSVVDGTVGDNSSQSARIEFQLNQENRWSRLTTFDLYGTPSGYIPNPTVYFNQPLTLRVLYKPNPTPCSSPPAVAVVDPAVGAPGQTVSVTLTGGNFVNNLTGVKLTRTGQTAIRATNVVVSDAGHLTCSFNLTGAAEGQWNVVVGTCAYATLSNGFRVCAPPTVATVVPNQALPGDVLTGVAITGTNFASGATVKLTKSGQSDIAATGVTVVDAGNITCDLALTGAAVGKWNVVVTTCASGALTDGFEVKSACNTPPQDADGDHDVDLGDFSLFAACFNGPNNPWPGPPMDQAVCACEDVDKDLDVDLGDFSAFASCFNGPNNPPACGT